MRGGRGQAAMEFLTTYGWAVMVVLLTIGVLVYYGALSTDRFHPEICAMSPGFGCIEYAASATSDEIYLGIQNNLANDILSATMTVDSSSCSNSPITIVYNNIPNGFRLLQAGESGITTINCADLSDDRVKGFISIRYRKLNEEVEHDAEGEFRLRTS